jgi:hypothetical protein
MVKGAEFNDSLSQDAKPTTKHTQRLSFNENLVNLAKKIENHSSMLKLQQRYGDMLEQTKKRDWKSNGNFAT